MSLHERTVCGRTVKIHTSHDRPPIPSREVDWSAVTDDYEAWTDDEGHWTTTHPAGFGPTEEAAIADLLAEIEANEP